MIRRQPQLPLVAGGVCISLVSCCSMVALLALLHTPGAAAFRSLAYRAGAGARAAAATGFLHGPARPSALPTARGAWTRPLAAAAATSTAADAKDAASKEGGAGGGVGPVRYAHEEIEPRWQRFWEENEVFKVRMLDAMVVIVEQSVRRPS